MTKFHNVKCPYCFNTFSYNDALFRKEDGERSNDQYIENYNYSIGGHAYKNKLFGYVDPADCEKCDLILDGDYLVGVNDVSSNKNIELTQRICPFCHNKISRNYGKKDVKFIAVVGVPNSGKTTYLAAANYSLKENKNFTWTSLDYQANKSLEDITKSYASNDVDAYVASHFVLGPYYYNLSFGGEGKKIDTDIVFFDVPGEAYVTDDFNKEKINKYIEAADGIIFIINSAHQLEAGSIDQKLVKVPQILDLFKENDISGSKKVAIIFNKIDKVAKELSISNLNFFTPPPYDGNIDKEKLLSMSQSIKSFFLKLTSKNQNEIQKELSSYMEQISLLFSQNMIFASTLINEEKKIIVDEDGNDRTLITHRFNPSGAETPLLWMLSEIGAFSSGDAAKEKSK